jgi:hypothetical protein
MIVSHAHRFVFLKTRKTAGTSVEIALSRHCGPDDIITPLVEEDEKLRLECGGRGAQNYDGARSHMPAYRVRDLIGRKAWRSYFKFTVERNPWDTAVSGYAWTYRQAEDRERLPFSTFVAEVLPEKRTNAGIYHIGPRLAVDKVCRYEQLDEEMAKVWAHLGLPGAPDLPRAKSGLRDARHYRDYYTPADVEAVRALYAKLIDEFDYEF